MEQQGTPQATPQDSQANEVKQPVGTGTQATQTSNTSTIKDAATEARRKLKIDDQEVDEEEVIKTYRDRKGHQKEANKRFQEGLKAKKQAEEFISMMKDKGKLFDTIRKLGHDPRQLSEEYLASVLQDEMMDPKEKEIKELRSKLTTHEEKEKQITEEREKSERETLKKKYAEKYTAEFVDALKTVNLPPTKEMVGEMAKYIARAAKINFEMTPQEAAKLVQQDEDTRIEHRLKNATPEQIIQILKEEGVQKVRGYDTSRLKDPNSGLKTPTEQSEPNTARARNSSKPMTVQQWRRHKMGLD